mgnify:CR=1 FL=1
MNGKLDILNCYLCAKCECAKVCSKLDLEKILLGVWFDNEKYIASSLPNKNPCLRCDGRCQRNCVSSHVYIKDLIKYLYSIKKECKKIKCKPNILQTSFFGKHMENPFMLSSSIVSSSYKKLAAAFKLGWAGASIKSISYIKSDEASPRYNATKSRQGSFDSFKNIEQLSVHSPEQDMAMIRRLKKDFPTKIIIASVVGRNGAEWVKLAKMAQSAGADAVELSYSCPNMEDQDSETDIGQNPKAIKKFTSLVRKAVKIPILVKLTPNVASMVDSALAVKESNANGIVAIDTVKSIMEPMAKSSKNDNICIGGMSGKAIKPIALRFIAEMKKHPKLKSLHLVGVGGIETYNDVLDYLSLGCDWIQVTTAIMQYGVRIIKPLIDGLSYYMTSHNITGVKKLVGARLKKVKPLNKIERNTIIYPKFNRNKCIKCGRCYISCRDGGQNAISLDKNGYPLLNSNKCVGCHLCTFVCPKKAVISSDTKVKHLRNK